MKNSLLVPMSKNGGLYISSFPHIFRTIAILHIYRTQNSLYTTPLSAHYTTQLNTSLRVQEERLILQIAATHNKPSMTDFVSHLNSTPLISTLPLSTLLNTLSSTHPQLTQLTSALLSSTGGLSQRVFPS